MKIIFAVDDSDTNLTMVETALEDFYHVMTIPSATRMFDLLKRIIPDLILLDIEMPEMNGFEALQRLKQNSSWSDIPVMFLTGRNDPSVEVHGFTLGAVDFITKPFSAPVLLNRIKTHLDIDEIIRERTSQLNRIQNSIISVLAEIVESRDKRTGGHIERTSSYIKLLIDEMKARSLYIDEIKKLDIEKIIFSARMHDLGKITISDTILNKPGKLTEKEYTNVKTHAQEGERIMDEIISRTGDIDFLDDAKLLASTHHERWDGTGYPKGLKGTNIPLHGRLMAFADVYDALVSERPYKRAYSHQEAVNIIMENAGTQLDPNIAEVFLEINEKFKEIIE
jgi:putative two-component system response regulator